MNNQDIMWTDVTRKEHEAVDEPKDELSFQPVLRMLSVMWWIVFKVKIQNTRINFLDLNFSQTELWSALYSGI
jgi:hypothetical protein